MAELAVLALVRPDERKFGARAVELGLELGLRAQVLVARSDVALEALGARPVALRMLRIGVHCRVLVAVLARRIAVEAFEVARALAAMTRATRDRRVLRGQREPGLLVGELVL